MYILNERLFIEDLIEKKTKPKDLSIGYLINLLTRYYILEIVKDKDDIKNINTKQLGSLVKNTLLSFNIDNYQEYLYANKIGECIKEQVKIYCSSEQKGHKKSIFKEIPYIPVFKQEIENISSLKTATQKKFLFTLYVIARFADSDGWINKKDASGLSEVFKIANVRISSDKKFELLNYLYTNNYISLAKKVDNLNIKINLQSSIDDIVAYKVIDFENLGNQYMCNFMDGYRQCDVCGKLIRISSNKKNKYCKKCKKEKELEWSRNYKCHIRSLASDSFG